MTWSSTSWRRACLRNRVAAPISARPVRTGKALMTTLLDTSPQPRPRPSGVEPEPTSGSVLAGRIVTALLVVGPPVALAVAIPLLWGHAINLLDVVLFAIFYVVSGFGVTVGFHRLFTHRSFRAARWL